MATEEEEYAAMGDDGDVEGEELDGEALGGDGADDSEGHRASVSMTGEDAHHLLAL